MNLEKELHLKNSQFAEIHQLVAQVTNNDDEAKRKAHSMGLSTNEEVCRKQFVLSGELQQMKTIINNKKAEIKSKVDELNAKINQYEDLETFYSKRKKNEKQFR